MSRTTAKYRGFYTNRRGEGRYAGPRSFDTAAEALAYAVKYAATRGTDPRVLEMQAPVDGTYPPTRTLRAADLEPAAEDERTYCTVHEAGACPEGCPHAYAGELVEEWDDPYADDPQATDPAYVQHLRELEAAETCPRCGKLLGMGDHAGVLAMADYGTGESGPMPVEEIAAVHATCVRPGDRVQVALGDSRQGLVRVAFPATTGQVAAEWIAAERRPGQPDATNLADYDAALVTAGKALNDAEVAIATMIACATLSPALTDEPTVDGLRAAQGALYLARLAVRMGA